MDSRDVHKGDPIEVRFLRRDATEWWRPATVTVVTRSAIMFQFADGERMAKPRDSREWRLLIPQGA